MLTFRHPRVDLDRHRDLNASWIGEPIRTRPGYRLDHHSGVVGHGPEDFARAAAAVRRWDMARLRWTSVQATDPTDRVGTQVAVVARVFPFWSISIGKITHVEQSDDRLAISYGTTGDHVATGEEQFELTLTESGDVEFAVTAVSRPARWWVWAGYPIVRLAQARFRRDAVAAIRAAAQK